MNPLFLLRVCGVFINHVLLPSPYSLAIFLVSPLPLSTLSLPSFYFPVLRVVSGERGTAKGSLFCPRSTCHWANAAGEGTRTSPAYGMLVQIGEDTSSEATFPPPPHTHTHVGARTRNTEAQACSRIFSLTVFCLHFVCFPFIPTSCVLCVFSYCCAVMTRNVFRVFFFVLCAVWRFSPCVSGVRLSSRS